VQNDFFLQYVLQPRLWNAPFRGDIQKRTGPFSGPHIGPEFRGVGAQKRAGIVTAVDMRGRGAWSGRGGCQLGVMGDPCSPAEQSDLQQEREALFSGKKLFIRLDGFLRSL
jgi:hypothetical protein